MKTRIKECDKNNGLSGLDYDFLYWEFGNETICIDGHFTFQELREIADYMQENMDAEEIEILEDEPEDTCLTFEEELLP